MTNEDAPILTQSLSNESDDRIAFEIDCLYQDVYYAFEREFGLTCSLDGFNAYIDKEQFKRELTTAIGKKGTSQSDIMPHLLGLVVPGVTTATVINPAGRGQAMFNIAQALFPEVSGTAKFYADMFNLDIAVGMEELADKIGEQMKKIPTITGANIFNRGGRASGGGGGRTNDEGELELSGAPYNSYWHHEPVKNSLNWNLDIDNTMLGTTPQWNSDYQRTCFVGKFNMLQFPNDETSLKQYYQDTLLPVIRNAMQANKRYTADLSTFFTYDMFKQYVNTIIQAIAIYYFFANGFAYCNEPGLVNNNAAIRNLRQQIFATAQLQRFQQLGQLLDSLPIPQTLINAVAQYHGWYSNSPEPGATLYCNIPHGIFKDNNLQNLDNGLTAAIDRLQDDVIINEIEKLNQPIITTGTGTYAVDMKNSQKFLALLLNTIPGWRNSSVSGSFFATDLYDEAHWNEFMNSPAVHRITMYYDNSTLIEEYGDIFPYYVDQTDTERYHSIGSNVPGYLQAYWTPLSWANTSQTSLNHHGFIKTQPREVTYNLSHTGGSDIRCKTWSNVIVWSNTGGLVSTGGTSMEEGFTLYPSEKTQKFGPNIGSPVTWRFDNGERPQGVTNPNYTNVWATVSELVVQPALTYNTINMSLNQCLPNRLIAIQKLLDVQDFFTLTSPVANKQKTGRRGRKADAKSKSNDSQSDEMDGN